MARPGTSSTAGGEPGDGTTGWGGHARKPNCRAVRCVLIKTYFAFIVIAWYLELLNFLINISIFALLSIFFQKSVLKCSENRSADDEPPTEQEKFELDSFPSEVKGRVLEHLEYEQIFQLKLLSKDWKSLIESHEFIQLRAKPVLTACYFFTENDVLQWAGFDPNWSTNSSSVESSTNCGKWRRLPPLTFLPPICDPNPDLFKQFLFCARDGLVCMNFSKSPHEERLIVFNPLTQNWKELPPLLYRRNLVLMHILVDQVTNSYQILAAGSSGSGDENLSEITELFDSRTGQWERVGDFPGPAFSLNEYQSGVFLKGNIFCLGFLELHDQIVKGILGYNVAERRWSTKWTDCALPNSPILQLVENSGDLYMFSERENGRFTEHWVDRVEWTQKKGGEMTTFKLVNVIKKQKIGGRSLEVYPEFALVPYSKWQLCIYNTVDHTGEVLDIQDQDKCEALPALPEQGFRGEMSLFTLNPMAFAIEPRFSSKV